MKSVNRSAKRELDEGDFDGFTEQIRLRLKNEASGTLKLERLPAVIVKQDQELQQVNEEAKELKNEMKGNDECGGASKLLKELREKIARDLEHINSC